jgi:hypothetical protein
VKKEKQILEEVDKTLKSFDDFPKLEANPFMFTRIEAKLNAPVKSNSMLFPGLDKITLKSLALVLIIVVNIITALYFFNTETKAQLIYSLSRDYNSTQSDF